MDSEIKELEAFFAGVKLTEFDMGGHGYIRDIGKFVSSNLSIAKANPENKRFLPYLERVRQLKIKIEKNNGK